MNFASTILSAGMVGLAHADHRMALESLLGDEAYHAYQHHVDQHYMPEHREPHHFETAYHDVPLHDHEDDYYFAHHRPVHHEEYSAYEHDRATEFDPQVSYKRTGDEEFKGEFDQSCAKKDFCSTYAELLSRHHQVRPMRHHDDYYYH